MLIANDVIKNIDSIVERSYVDFTYDIIGDEFLTDEQKIQLESLGMIVGRRPLIELLYILVRQRSHQRYRKDESVQNLIQQIADSGVLPPLSERERSTIDNAKASMDEVVETAKKKVKSRVTNKIVEVNRRERDFQISGLPDSLERKEKRHSRLLNVAVIGIGAAIKDAHKDFLKGWTTQLTNFINESVADSAMAASSSGKSRDVLVYKNIVGAGTCKWCRDFYVGTDGKPKVYKLSQLLKNGSNYGKPKSQWKPTVGSTHPRCRCELFYVKRTDS